VLELINQVDYKYIRALAIFYYRLVETSPAKIYSTLEPLYSDYRRLVFREASGKHVILHMDEFIDKLLVSERFCEVLLPRIPKRWTLVEEG
jgi:pre-mRNA-splicing factor 38A